MNARESLLTRVKQAVAQGNRLAPVPDLPDRGQTGSAPSRANATEVFCANFTAAGGQVKVVASREAAVEEVIRLAAARAAKAVLVGNDPWLVTLGIQRALTDAGCELITPDRLEAGTAKDRFFAADLGVSKADFLIADTGSVVILTRPEEPRSHSLLPPVHVVLAERASVLPELFLLFETGLRHSKSPLPSAVTLITGPSKTGDIELQLVTGVHGPGEVLVVLIDG